MLEYFKSIKKVLKDFLENIMEVDFIYSSVFATEEDFKYLEKIRTANKILIKKEVYEKLIEEERKSIEEQKERIMVLYGRLEKDEVIVESLKSLEELEKEFDTNILRNRKSVYFSRYFKIVYERLGKKPSDFGPVATAHTHITDHPLKEYTIHDKYASSITRLIEMVINKNLDIIAFSCNLPPYKNILGKLDREEIEKYTRYIPIEIV